MKITEIAKTLKLKLRNDIDEAIKNTNNTQEFADKIDLNEIERIVAALDDIDPYKTIDDRELFIAKFNKAHGSKILTIKKKQKKSFYYYVGKVTCCAASISIVFAGANTITGIATGKTICDRVIDMLRSVEYTYYETGREKVISDADFEFKDNTDITASFEDIREKTKFDFLVPQYIPNGYKNNPEKH